MPKAGETVTILEGSKQNWDTIDINGDPKTNGTIGSGTSAQTFTVPMENELGNIKWRVLSIKNGCVNLISEKEIGKNGEWKSNDGNDGLKLGDITGYSYGPQVLNDVCSIYGTGEGAKGARSITVDDVNEITGYNVEDSVYNERYMKKHVSSVSDSRINFEWMDNEYSYEYNQNGMNLKTENEESIEYKLLFQSDAEEKKMSYWLASRCMSTALSYNLSYCIRIVSYGKVDATELAGFDDEGQGVTSSSYPFRPIVSLKSTVKYIAGDGTSNSPIEFTVSE